MNSATQKKQRLDAANELLSVISRCGRRFFEHQGFVSRMELSPQGRVFFVDYYTKEKIYTHYNGSWKGFTSGSTLKDFIIKLRIFISTGDKLTENYLDLSVGRWGYGDAANEVKTAAGQLGVV